MTIMYFQSLLEDTLKYTKQANQTLTTKKLTGTWGKNGTKINEQKCPIFKIGGQKMPQHN